MITMPTGTRVVKAPLFEFYAHVDGCCALVTVLYTGIEWSLAGDRLFTEMIPTTSITAVSSEPGRFMEALIVETDERTIEFRVAGGVADDARGLLHVLMAVDRASTRQQSF